MSFCLRVVPRFGGNVNINKPLAAFNGTSTQYRLFSAINGRVLVLIYFKSFHLISALEIWNATLRHICLHYSDYSCPLFTSGASFSIAHEYSVRKENCISGRKLTN